MIRIRRHNRSAPEADLPQLLAFDWDDLLAPQSPRASLAVQREQGHTSQQSREAPRMHARAVVLTAAIVIAPLGAWGADLVAYWQKGVYAQRDEAISGIVAAFEQGSDKALDCRPRGLENEVVRALGDVRDAARKLSFSIRSNQAKVSSGRDNTNSKTFFDYKAAARLKEAQNALDRLTTTKALGERGYASKEIELIQQATLHGSSRGKRARDRAKQAQAQLHLLSQRCIAENAQRWTSNQ